MVDDFNIASVSGKKKIAILGIKALPAFAGADRVVECILENIGNDYEYYIYLINTRNKFLDSGNKHFIYLPALRGKHLKAFSFFTLCTLHLLIRKKFDLIHLHNSDLGLFACILKFKYKNRIIGTFHGNPYESSKWGNLAKFYLKFSEQLFIKSCSSLTSVSNAKKIRNRKVFFIPNGVEKIDEDIFVNYKNISVNYEQRKIKKNDYILFACGRAIRSKGLHHLLESYGNNSINNQLVIVGDFSHDHNYRNEIINKINSSGKNIILIKELLPKNDLYDLINNSKLVVFPSENEAMSMLLMEVIGCDKIVVSSDIDANVKILGKKYKYLFKNKDVSSLATAIKIALEDMNNQSVKKVDMLKTRVMYKYSWSGIANKYKKIYDSYPL